jgi:hypothetical protein
MTGAEVLAALDSDDEATRAAAEREVEKVTDLHTAMRAWAKVPRAIIQLAEEGDAEFFLAITVAAGEYLLSLTACGDLEMDVVRQAGQRDIADEAWDGERGIEKFYEAIALAAPMLGEYRQRERLRNLLQDQLVHDDDLPEYPRGDLALRRARLTDEELFALMRLDAVPRGAAGLDPAVSRTADNAKKRVRRAATLI